MIKLVKEVNDKLHYWEVWNEGKTITEHWGIVGEPGENKEFKVGLFIRTDKEMGKLADEKMNEGYLILDEEHLPELIIQHSNKGLSMKEALKKREQVEDLLNECLGWTGNGFVDGGEIEVEAFLTNVFCPVVDVDAAFHTVLAELQKHQLAEDVIIAYCGPEPDEDDEDEDYDNPYITLYPEGAKLDH